jgi:hypothetical protein
MLSKISLYKGRKNTLGIESSTQPNETGNWCHAKNYTEQYKIWGFHGGEDSYCSLLGYIMSSGRWVPMFLGTILSPSQGKKMAAASYFKTLVLIYQNTTYIQNYYIQPINRKSTVQMQHSNFDSGYSKVDENFCGWCVQWYLIEISHSINVERWHNKTNTTHYLQ